MSNLQYNCPFDDCTAQVTVTEDTEVGDLVICRSENGCNRNVEVLSVSRDSSGNVENVELEAFKDIDEDWGE